MRQFFRRIITYFLLFTLSFALLPLCAFADESVTNDGSLTSDTPVTADGPVTSGPIDPTSDSSSADINAVICSHVYQFSYVTTYSQCDAQGQYRDGGSNLSLRKMFI